MPIAETQHIPETSDPKPYPRMSLLRNALRSGFFPLPTVIAAAGLNFGMMQSPHILWILIPIWLCRGTCSVFLTVCLSYSTSMTGETDTTGT